MTVIIVGLYTWSY